MIKQRKTIDYNSKIYDLLHNAQSYHDKYYVVQSFGGPSLYFHLKALESSKNDGDFNRSLEYIYAMLTS